MSKVSLNSFRKHVLWFAVLFSVICAERLTYISIEHATVLHVDPDYFTVLNFTAFRYGRSNPVYYVNLDYITHTWMGNNFSLDFYFFEFLTNRYKRSFVEMHFRYCKLIHEDLFFGAAMKQGKLDAPCPYPPDRYPLQNMTILPEAIPPGFPFTKGRIMMNMTFVPKKLMVMSGYVDMEIKQLKVKNRKKSTKLK